MTQPKKSNLHGNLPFGSYPPRPSVNKMTSKFYTEEHDICDGEVKLLRTKQSGKVWQMRCWIKPEKRHFKKSLRTKDFEEAKTKGRRVLHFQFHLHTYLLVDSCLTISHLIPQPTHYRGNQFGIVFLF